MEVFKGRTEEPPLNETIEILIKKVHLTHKENIEETKEVLRKPGSLSLPL